MASVAGVALSAPWRLACWAKVQKCRLEVIELLPQIRISRLSA